MLRWTHLAAAALLIVPLTLSPGAAPAPDLTDLARYAYIFTFPLYEMYRIRYLALCSPLNPPRYYQHGNFFDHPRRSWSWADVRRTAPQFCGLKFMDTGAMAVPIAGVRFGHSTTRRRGGRRPPPREDPAQTGHALAGGFDNRTTWLQRSLQPAHASVKNAGRGRQVLGRRHRSRRAIAAAVLPPARRCRVKLRTLAEGARLASTFLLA